jgi:hypothetical protein
VEKLLSSFGMFSLPVFDGVLKETRKNFRIQRQKHKFPLYQTEKTKGKFLLSF